MIRTEFLKQLDKLDFAIHKRVTSNFVGGRRAELGGSGIIFRDYSSYVYGDDFKQNVVLVADQKDFKIEISKLNNSLVIKINDEVKGTFNNTNNIGYSCNNT